MKKISIEKYNEKMSKIIKMGKPITDTLSDMLEEASKWEIINEMDAKDRKGGKRLPIDGKRIRHSDRRK